MFTPDCVTETRAFGTNPRQEAVGGECVTSQRVWGREVPKQQLANVCPEQGKLRPCGGSTLSAGQSRSGLHV